MMSLHLKKECLPVHLLLILLFLAGNRISAQTVDLSLHVTDQHPAGAVLEWHSALPPNAANKIINTSSVGPGTYYAVYYDTANDCYSPSAKLIVAANSCPVTSFNLNTRIIGPAPDGSIIQWHTTLPPTQLNKVANPEAAEAGTYYAVYYDSINNCYSPTSSPVVVIVESCLPLPIQLIRFSGTADQCKAVLTWTAVMGKGDERFDIQQSDEGSNFLTIGTVHKDETNIDRNQYRFSAAQRSKKAFYRLQLTDHGAYSYSNVISVVTLCDNKSIKVHPNPVKDILTISGLDENATLQLCNNMGQSLIEKKSIGGTQSINVAAYPSGIYLLKVQYTDGRIMDQKRISIVK
jgi:hypothetical protein